MTVTDQPLPEPTLKAAVRAHYARAAGGACCGSSPAARGAPGACCGSASVPSTADGPLEAAIPSLGCGSPVEAAALQPGETVVDLGSGRGLDAFRAAQRVGPSGRVIGVDMTPEMVWAAREDARRLGFGQVAFRVGEIEHLPLPDACADVVISNCVINLVPDKDRAFAEAFRVLRPGGRLVVSDLVRRGQRIDPVDPGRWAACLDGAEPESTYLARITGAGFATVEVLARGGGELDSLTVRAVKAA